ncbi:MAG: DegT/DnrJ/EryC1/StrS family aminotransferase [Bdellovibrionales bacterium]|nr:DegT/DnrJ/EryC1/StrS family aminotransferase [Bdellovibrionales bacterium]
MQALERVMDSGWVVLGPEVKAFEAEFAQSLGAPHAVGVNSGTDALVIALKALGVDRESEVITVANTAVPTVSAIRMCGAKPVFVDIEASTLLMDVSKVEALITERTRCIIPVHLHGLSVDMDPLLAIAQGHQIPIIEDCAQSQGAEYKGKATGTMGSMGCFSFYPTKNMGAFGDGGLITCQSETHAEAMQQLRMYGFKGDGYAHREGINSRLDEIQAAMLRIKLTHFAESFSTRRKLAEEFHERIQNPQLRLPLEPEGRMHAYHLFVIHCEQREELIKHLQSHHIGFGIHYAVPIHRMKAYEFLDYLPGSLPNTELAADSILSLPFYPLMPEQDKEQLFQVLNSFR